MPPESLPAFQQALVAWFQSAQRNLPWRRAYDPYQVWISEIMLQQTQVKTVLPYYERWMRRLPDLQQLAEVEESELMKLWEGLGYYSRARNLKRAAQQVCAEHGGELPRNVAELKQLPGIGPYTAGAIASIAYNQDAPIVDGNVLRVLCRLEALDAPPDTPALQKQLWQLAQEWIPSGQARWFNQGLMELGATVCLPRNPECLLCPVRAHCQALAQGRVSELPRPKARKAPTEVNKAVAVIRWGEALLIRQRREPGLMQGLWELPTVECPQNQPLPGLLEAWLHQELGTSAAPGALLQQATHRYTTFKATLHCFNVSLKPLPLPEHWTPVRQSNVAQYAFPTVYRKLIIQFFKKLLEDDPFLK